MEKEVQENYVRAGRITAEIKRDVHQIVKTGEPLLRVAEAIEKAIREKGGEPAFPVNISVNDVAAHYTPTHGETTLVKENDIVKIDLGVHIDGYVADTAITVNFNPDYADLVKAAEAALAEGIKEVRPDARIADIAEAIENTIKNAGYKPIANLTGHGLNRWDLHTEPTIPNVSFKSDQRLKEDQVIAIEPFATDGSGVVKDSEQVFIFMIVGNTPVRNMDARAIMNLAEQYSGLPFAERWIPGSLFKTRLALRELRNAGNLYDFHVLKEAKGGMVSQAEHTVIVKDNPIIITQ